MNFEAASVLVSSGTQVQPQITLDPDYFPDFFSVSYDYDNGEWFKESCTSRYFPTKQIKTLLKLKDL